MTEIDRAFAPIASWPPPDPSTCVLAVNPRGKVERNLELVAAYDAGATEPELAARFSLTPQRISQLLANAGRSPSVRRAEAAAYRQAMRRLSKARLCKACQRFFVPDRTHLATCSDLCNRAWQIARRYLDPVYYRKLRRRQGFGDRQPNRRFYVPTSEAVQLLMAIGRTDVLPKKSRKPRLPSCTAMNKNGSPCNRSAAPGDDLCHIHRAFFNGIPLNRKTG